MNTPHFRRSQQGVTLVVVLILLLVMTLLALAGIRGTVLEERMAANQYDRSLAFQAAEAALREGEKYATNTHPKVADATCTAGDCGRPAPDATPVWEVESNWDDAHAVTGNYGNLAVAPKYLVELLADDVPEVNPCETTSIDPDAPCYTGPEGLRYRITARSGEDGRAMVTLQATFAMPKPSGW